MDTVTRNCLNSLKLGEVQVYRNIVPFRLISLHNGECHRQQPAIATRTLTVNDEELIGVKAPEDDLEHCLTTFTNASSNSVDALTVREARPFAPSVSMDNGTDEVLRAMAKYYTQEVYSSLEIAELSGLSSTAIRACLRDHRENLERYLEDALRAEADDRNIGNEASDADAFRRLAASRIEYARFTDLVERE